jgi:hypothetical protein
VAERGLGFPAEAFQNFQQLGNAKASGVLSGFLKEVKRDIRRLQLEIG